MENTEKRQSLIDQIRTVPEIAVRLWAGAEKVRENGSFTIGLDGQTHTVSPQVFELANAVNKALQVRERKVEYISEVLELRHDAEDLYLEQILPEKDLKILFVPAGVSGGSFYRSRLPAEFLTQGGTSTGVEDEETSLDLLAHHTECLDLSKAMRYDVLMIQLAAVPMLYNIAKEAQENGVKIVYDIDDKWDSVREDGTGGVMFVKEMKENIEKIIKLADIVTVSTEPLKKYVESKGAKRVIVVPNRVPTPVLPSRDLVDPEIFRILWAGSPTHKHDLAIVAPALCTVLKNGAGAVRFTCFGEKVPEELESVQEYVDPIRFADFGEYAQILAETGAHLAIAPLVDNEFNRCKSAIKYLEYSTAGYPGLYSPVGEYQALWDQGAPIQTVEDGEWEEELTNHIKEYSRKWLFDKGREAQNWVKENRCLADSKAIEWAKVAFIAQKETD